MRFKVRTTQGNQSFLMIENYETYLKDSEQGSHCCNIHTLNIDPHSRRSSQGGKPSLGVESLTGAQLPL